MNIEEAKEKLYQYFDTIFVYKRDKYGDRINDVHVFDIFDVVYTDGFTITSNVQYFDQEKQEFGYMLETAIRGASYIIVNKTHQRVELHIDEKDLQEEKCDEIINNLKKMKESMETINQYFLERDNQTATNDVTPDKLYM